MRLSVILLCCSVAGVLGGAALVGVWALGLAIVFVSLCAGYWAIIRDDGQEQPAAAARRRGLHAVPSTHEQVLDRYRAS